MLWCVPGPWNNADVRLGNWFIAVGDLPRELVSALRGSRIIGLYDWISEGL